MGVLAPFVDMSALTDSSRFWWNAETRVAKDVGADLERKRLIRACNVVLVSDAGHPMFLTCQLWAVIRWTTVFGTFTKSNEKNGG